MGTVKTTEKHASAWRQWYDHVHTCDCCHDVVQNVSESFALRRPDLYCKSGNMLLREVYAERGMKREYRLAA